MAKTICWIKQKKTVEVERNGDKDGKLLYKLMVNAVHGTNNAKLEK